MTRSSRQDWRLAPQNGAKNPGDRTGWPIRFLQEQQDQRTAWLAPAAEQVRQWREEDRSRGIIWNDGERK